MRYLLEHVQEHPVVTILYFEPDAKKSGGSYREITGKVLKARLYERELWIEGAVVIPFRVIPYNCSAETQQTKSHTPTITFRMERTPIKPRRRVVQPEGGSPARRPYAVVRLPFSSPAIAPFAIGTGL